ncbi:MAG: hypothetical protein Q8L75_16295, partial [Acidobacteriota bacterium]|nr:hypothetical protein [Acidobacteriota bacterium]
MSISRIAIAPGYDVSRILKGGWQLAGGHGAIDRAAALKYLAAIATVGLSRPVEYEEARQLAWA